MFEYVINESQLCIGRSNFSDFIELITKIKRLNFLYICQL